MKRGQSTLDLFVKRPKIVEGEYFSEVERPSKMEKVEANEECSTSSTTADTLIDLPSGMQKNDVGYYIDSISCIDDKTKCELIENPWRPSLGHKLPYSTHNKQGKTEKRYLNQSHLDSFSWLVYSDAKKGLFCKYCTLFVTAAMGGSHKHVPLQKLVKQPLTVFAKLLGKDGDLSTHEKQQYHGNAVETAKDFLKTYYVPQENIMNRINSQRLQQVQENRQRLKPVVESILFLGRQNIPLRGHRDDGELNVESQREPLINEGNFRELLRFRVNCGDLELENHLKNSRSNATYISKNTQNQLIECCAE